MTIHLIKLSVGTQSVDGLRAWQKTVIERHLGTEFAGYHTHTTRMFPKRREEILSCGSMYWVIGGQILVRQQIADLVEVQTNEGRKCTIVLDPDLVLVNPTVRGPFQGWRYLQPQDAPGDLGLAGAEDDLPIRAELAELGLL